MPKPYRFSDVLSNTYIAELLAQQAERETGILSRAFRRAARSAFLRPENMTNLLAQNRSLTELRAIGPFIERQILRWIDKPPRLGKKIQFSSHNANVSAREIPSAIEYLV
jgi:hypothetical protein